MGASWGQSLSVAQFNILDNDLDARANYPKMDSQTGKKCAIIKVVTTQKGFNFDIGQMAIDAVEPHPELSEIWLYVPEGTRKLKITHPQLGQLKTETNDGYYWLPSATKSAYCYRLELVSGMVNIVVEKEVVKTGFLILNTDLDNVDVYFKGINGQDSLVDVIGPQKPLMKKFPYGTHHYKLKKNLYHDEVGVAVIDKDRVEQNVTLIPAYGSLHIESVPTGAAVTIEGLDGRHSTPCVIDKLKSGNYTVRLTMDKYSAATRNVSINDGVQTDLRVNMEANFGTLTIQSLPMAEIRVDGSYKGNSGCTLELEPGFYNIEVQLASHKSVKQQVEVKTNQTETIKIEPTPIYGSLDVLSVPYDATVLIDGKEVGKTPLSRSDVLVGERKVEVVKKGCAPVEKMITMREGAQEKIDVTLVQGVAITINSKPSNASVFVNGNPMGDSPLNHVFPFGRHVVMVTNGNRYVEKSISVSTDANVSSYTFDLNGSESHRVWKRSTFILANFAYANSLPSAGVTVGRAKHFGWFVSAMTGFDFNGYASTQDFSSGGNVCPFLNGEVSYQRLSLMAGPVLKVSNGFAFKLGVGYGMNNMYAQSEDEVWYRVADASEQGLDLSFGIQLNIGKLAVSLEGVATNFSLFEAKGGIGVNF